MKFERSTGKTGSPRRWKLGKCKGSWFPFARACVCMCVCVCVWVTYALSPCRGVAMYFIDKVYTCTCIHVCTSTLYLYMMCITLHILNMQQWVTFLPSSLCCLYFSLSTLPLFLYIHVAGIASWQWERCRRVSRHCWLLFTASWTHKWVTHTCTPPPLLLHFAQVCDAGRS